MIKAPRAISVITTILLVLTGCGLSRGGSGKAVPTGPTKVGSGVDIPADATAKPARTATPQKADPAAGKATPKPAAKKTTLHVDEVQPPKGFEFGEGEATGKKLSLRILRSSTPKLVIEVDAVEGTTVDNEGLAQFANYIKGVTGKSTVEVMPTQIIPKKRNNYSARDYFELMEQYRQTDNNNASVASVWVVYVPNSGEGEAWAGQAPSESNGIIAMNDRYTKTDNARAGGRARLQRAVLTHELGHVMGLVNIYYTSPRDREDTTVDPAGGGHTNNAESVMYWKVSSPSLTEVILEGGVAVHFDNDDLADLEGLREGDL